jgi:hypothetical protein
MASTMTAAAATNSKGEDAAGEIARPLQDLKKCRYCNYEHWDEFDFRFHEEMHKEYCEEKEVKRQKCREYEMLLMRRFNLKKEINSLQRSFAANEINIKDYESDEETKEFAYQVRERVWENRARKNWRSDTSFVDEHLELGYYVLTDRERELAIAASLHTSDPGIMKLKASCTT